MSPATKAATYPAITTEIPPVGSMAARVAWASDASFVTYDTRATEASCSQGITSPAIEASYVSSRAAAIDASWPAYSGFYAFRR